MFDDKRCGLESVRAAQRARLNSEGEGRRRYELKLGRCIPEVSPTSAKKNRKRQPDGAASTNGFR